MLTSDELDFLKGVVTDSDYPYYVVYPESFGANNRLIHIYLSKTQITVSGDTFHIDDAVYMQLSHDEYIKVVSEGSDVDFTIPVTDTLCYTSAPNTPLYPSIWQSSSNYSYEFGFDYPKLFIFVFAAVLVGSAIARFLFGGK
jgi:hypothetical protein